MILNGAVSVNLSRLKRTDVSGVPAHIYDLRVFGQVASATDETLPLVE